MTDFIACEVDSGVARITLNRPESLNAFNETMAQQWAKVTREVVARDDVRVVLLTGSGHAFCAGGDVRAMVQPGFRGEQLAELAKVISEGQLSLLRSSLPVVAAAHGTTAGGGLGILLSSDYAIAGESSKIGSIYAKLGLTPDLGATSLLARAVGERRALQLVLRDRLLTASEALEWGLVAEVVADDQVLARAEQVAREIAGHAAGARGEAKRLVRRGGDRDLLASLDDEAHTIGRALESNDAQALIADFVGR